MKKTFLYPAILLFLVSSIALFGANYLPETRLYKKIFSNHVTDINGITIGSSKSDVIFRMGPPIFCAPAMDTTFFLPFVSDLASIQELVPSSRSYTDPINMRCVWGTDNLSITFSASGKVLSMYVKTSILPGSLPTTTEALLSVFDEPRIYSISADLLRRLYTYSDDDLLNGVTYHYEGNHLVGFGLGAIKWRGAFDETYVVDGIQYCPGTTCPWAGNTLKTEWENKTVRHLQQTRNEQHRTTIDAIE